MIDYVPARGDIIWMDFDPSMGAEQKGRRPALVLSEKAFNHFGIAYCVPITTKVKGYKIEIPLEDDLDTKGVILTNQLSAYDWRQRNVEYRESVDNNILIKTGKILKVLLGL